jgi:hypothetical protein
MLLGGRCLLGGIKGFSGKTVGLRATFVSHFGVILTLIVVSGLMVHRSQVMVFRSIATMFCGFEMVGGGRVLNSHGRTPNV